MRLTGCLIAACVLFTCACSDNRSEVPVKKPFLESTHVVSSSAADTFSSENTSHADFQETTVDTSLSQEEWPSTEGNEVRIHYRDSGTTDVSVTIYGETFRSEYELFAVQNKIVRGISRSIEYRQPIYVNSKHRTEDTCAYSFEIQRDGTVRCAGVLHTSTNRRAPCTPCDQDTSRFRVTAKLVHDVEHLITHAPL
jgi:hypothetical protein